MANKRILFGILNWGLGHATRSMPIIDFLISKGHQVDLASDGNAYLFLKSRYPDLTIHELPSYDVTYSDGAWSSIGMMKTALKTKKAVKQENQWLAKNLNSNQWDIVISDNRYGLNHPNMPCAIITHQLNIQTPVFQGLVNKVNTAWLDQFNEIWVPDFKNKLAGKLAQPTPKRLQNKTSQIGWLSRFKSLVKTEPQFKIVGIISGPEPQRTTFQNQLINLLQNLPWESVLLTGNPKQKNSKIGNVTLQTNAPDKHIQDYVCGADLVISRPGYSSLMDYIQLKTPIFVVPTPGQTEQEFLAQQLLQNFDIPSVSQSDLNQTNILDALQKGQNIPLEFISDFGAIEKFTS